MKKIKMVFQALFRQKRARQGTAGFSLIELLVVVAIMGVLAGIAIPAFRNYQQSAAKNAMSSSMANIEKGFSACTTLKGFASCNTLGNIGITNCGNCKDGAVHDMAPNLCVGLTAEIRGKPFNGCVSLSASSGQGTRVFSERTCYKNEDGCIDSNNACDTSLNPASCPAGHPTASTAAYDSCDSSVAGLHPCTSNTDCTNEFGAGHVCATGMNGECQTTGLCN